MVTEKKIVKVAFRGEDHLAPTWRFEFSTLPEALIKVNQVMTTWPGFYEGHLAEYTATRFRHLLHFDTFPTKDYTNSKADKQKRDHFFLYGEFSENMKKSLAAELGSSPEE